MDRFPLAERSSPHSRMLIPVLHLLSDRIEKQLSVWYKYNGQKCSRLSSGYRGSTESLNMTSPTSSIASESGHGHHYHYQYHQYHGHPHSPHGPPRRGGPPPGGRGGPRYYRPYGPSPPPHRSGNVLQYCEQMYYSIQEH